MSRDRRRAASAPHQARGSVDRERVVAVLATVVTGAHLDLEDVEVRSAGRRRIVRVLVDAEHGVSLDEVAAVSREVSQALDDSDVLGEQPYTLEVSSPGVDRPLTLPRHWRRNTGRLVQVTLRADAPVTGRISAVDEGGVDLDLEPGTRRVAFEQVARAIVQVEFRDVEADESPDPPAAAEEA